MQEMEILPDFFFSSPPPPALYQLNEGLRRQLAKVNTFTASQPKAVSGHKLNRQYKPSIPLSQDCAAHEGQPEPKGKMGHG